jgi:hypothetical protein
VITVFMRDEHRRELGRIDSLGQKMFIERRECEPGLEEKCRSVGTEEIRVTRAAAGKRTKKEQDGAFYMREYWSDRIRWYRRGSTPEEAQSPFYYHE